MLASTSSSLPTLILPPNPPLAVGHRKATKPAAANVVSPAPVSDTVARFKNCRRLTPSASSSGGTHTAGSDVDAATRPVTRASLTARSTERPVCAAGRSMSASLSRRRVSRLSAPAPRTSARRAAVTSTMPANRMRTTTAMEMISAGLIGGTSQVEEQAVAPRQCEVEARTSEERTDDDEHRPEHDVHGHDRDRELAILWLVGWVLVDVRSKDQQDQADTGKRDAGDHRVEHRQQFLEAEEVPRGLRGVRRAVGVRLLQQRSVDPHGEEERERSARQRGDELGDEQVRPGVHLVDRRGLHILDRSALDDGQQSLGVTAGAGSHRNATGGRSG